MDNWELESIRADIETELLPDLCDILEPTRTANSMGGWNTVMGTVTAGVRCRLDPLTGRELTAAGVQQGFFGFRLTLPYDTVVSTGGRVKINGVSYNIISQDADKSWAATVRVLVERIG